MDSDAVNLSHPVGAGDGLVLHGRLKLGLAHHDHRGCLDVESYAACRDLRGTSKVKRNGFMRLLRVGADGQGVVSHAGLGMLRELAGYTGLVKALNEALVDTYKAVGPRAGSGADG